MASMHIAYIGLGSNLQNPIQQITQALLELDQMDNSYLLAYSSLYQSSAMTLDDNSEPQEDYINAVAKIATRLEPLQLLDKLQAIENSHERVREKRWGARTLDLDILLYDHTIMETERLTIPHYGIGQRDFVLKPLLELKQNLRMPDGSPIASLLEGSGQYNLKKLEWRSLGE